MKIKKLVAIAVIAALSVTAAVPAFAGTPFSGEPVNGVAMKVGENATTVIKAALYDNDGFRSSYTDFSTSDYGIAYAYRPDGFPISKLDLNESSVAAFGAHFDGDNLDYVEYTLDFVTGGKYNVSLSLRNTHDTDVFVNLYLNGGFVNSVTDIAAADRADYSFGEAYFPAGQQVVKIEGGHNWGFNLYELTFVLIEADVTADPEPSNPEPSNPDPAVPDTGKDIPATSGNDVMTLAVVLFVLSAVSAVTVSVYTKRKAKNRVDI